MLGGLLARGHEHATLSAVIACYALAFANVAIFFPSHVLPARSDKKVQ